jgi:hypothetical protein
VLDGIVLLHFNALLVGFESHLGDCKLTLLCDLF